MNMKNVVLVNEHVTLLVGDDSKYQEIALLVDRADFLEAVKMLRETLGIKAPLVNVYDNFSILFADGWKKEYQKWVEVELGSYFGKKILRIIHASCLDSRMGIFLLPALLYNFVCKQINPECVNQTLSQFLFC